MFQWSREGFASSWRPIELAAMVGGFLIYWPLGLAVLGWKLWNDRSPAPKEFETAVREGFAKARETAARFVGEVPGRAPHAANDRAAPTGNATFDAHVAAELARLDEARRRLDDEVAAFRTHLAREQDGDAEVFARFRARREDVRPAA